MRDGLPHTRGTQEEGKRIHMNEKSIRHATKKVKENIRRAREPLGSISGCPNIKKAKIGP